MMSKLLLSRWSPTAWSFVDFCMEYKELLELVCVAKDYVELLVKI